MVFYNLTETLTQREKQTSHIEEELDDLSEYIDYTQINSDNNMLQHSSVYKSFFLNYRL